MRSRCFASFLLLLSQCWIAPRSASQAALGSASRGAVFPAAFLPVQAWL